jgi:hypothetical protein
MINTKVRSINLLNQHKSQVVFNIQHKKSSCFTFNKTVKSIQSFCSKVESYNTKVKSVQSTCSNNTKDESFNVQHTSPFIPFAQTTQKPSHLTYNTKSKVVSLSNKTIILLKQHMSLSIQSTCSNNTKYKSFND